MKWVVINLKAGTEIVSVPNDNVHEDCRHYRQSQGVWVPSEHIYPSFYQARDVALRRYESRLAYFNQQAIAAQRNIDRIMGLQPEECRRVDSVTSHVIFGKKSQHKKDKSQE